MVDPLSSTPPSEPITGEEAARLAALRSYAVLDTPPEAAFDRITALAARLFQAPISLVSLVDEDRHWFKSSYGLNQKTGQREGGFCTEVIASDKVFVVRDAYLDPHFSSHPLVVGEEGVRFYAGAPLLDSQGYRLGSFCILDTKPREFNEADRATLADLASLVMDELELRLGKQRLQREIAEHREDEAALAQSERRFKNAFELSAIGTALVSPAGRWLQANRKLCELLDYSEAELKNLTLQELTYPEDLVRGLELIGQAASGQIDSFEFEKRYISRDGTLVWTLVSASVVRGEEGELLHFILQVQDISDRKQAEDDLRESEARKTAILDTALDCIITIDHLGHILEWNPAAEKTLGHKREDVLGQSLGDLIVPLELRERHAKGLQHFVATGEGPILGKRLELPALRADGEIITVELAVVPIPFVDPPIFTGHLRDITERKRITDALSESEARYHRIAANVPGMVYQFVMTADGNVSFPFVSDGCREIFALEPQTIMNNAMVLIGKMHPDDLPWFQETVTRSAQTLEPWEWDGRFIAPDNQIIWARGASRPRQGDNGEIIWDGLLFDVTQRKLEEEALQAAKTEAEIAREEAERANIAKSEFLSRMSHELRTPLNAILGFGQLLEMSLVDVDDVQSAEQIVKAGRHLLDLINEVLDIARIEAGHLALSPESVMVSEIGLEVLDLVRPLAAARGITFDDSNIRTCKCYVQADRQRLKQVLLNLLSNAVKYNRQGGRVMFGCRLHMDRTSVGTVRISVRDTGGGIDPNLRSRLFTPFDRLGAEKSGVEGTGMGLALSKRLAEAMEGKLDFESEVGQGTTFWIELPRSADPVERASQLPAPATLDEVVSTKLVVLYIEDNPSNLQLVQRLLRHRPEIRLLTAMQGGLGYELARQHIPDLILLDMNLPDISGQEVLARLRQDEKTASVPIIVVSADATAGQIERILQAGAQKYLTKPFDVREFLSILDGQIRENDPLVNSPGSEGQFK